MQPNRQNPLQKIAFISSVLPRQCGIATFNVHLSDALLAYYPTMKNIFVAINDPEGHYLYPDDVAFQIEQEDVISYRKAAKFLNQENVELVCLQHEYGLYGSSAGLRIVTLLQELDSPIVTILHTVLRSPDLQQRRVMSEISQLSNRLVTMTKTGVAFLQEIYKIPKQKISLIPHGVPEPRPAHSGTRNNRFALDGKRLLLTYGLLSPDKGIEYAIRALPDILKVHPDVTYFIAGSTHPNVRRQNGETYRQYLQQLVEELGVTNRVEFYDRFLDTADLIELISAAHICITPYLNKEHIVSGTLAYMVGRGKPVVSTPYWHAIELSTSGHVRIIPFKDSHAITEEVLHLLDNGGWGINDVNRVDLLERNTTWAVVAHKYMCLFQKVASERAESRDGVSLSQRTLSEKSRSLPEVNIDHLLRLTDNIGLLQHAVWVVPNYNEGYTTDDNARALVVAVKLKSLAQHEASNLDQLILRYTAFISHAFNRQVGRFRNFISFDRRWLEEVGSEESHGRALWGLGVLVNRLVKEQSLVDMASHLFLDALPVVHQFASPRAWAFAIMGIHEYLSRYTTDQAAEDLRDILAKQLVKLYYDHSSTEWPWFEKELSWFNARLPQALLLSGESMSRPKMTEIALRALGWLIELQRSEEGHFAPIGSQRIYCRGDGNVPRFDQQPIEACATISACIDAYRSSHDNSWLDEARRVFSWFMGNNDLRLPLYDSQSGGCRDGLHPDRVNENQGAESTLAFLLSLLDLNSVLP